MFSKEDIKKLKLVSKIYNSVKISNVVETLDESKTVAIRVNLDYDKQSFSIYDLNLFLKTIENISENYEINIDSKKIILTTKDIKVDFIQASEQVLKKVPNDLIFTNKLENTLFLSESDFKQLNKLFNSTKRVELSKNGLRIINVSNTIEFKEFDEKNFVKFDYNLFKIIPIDDVEITFNNKLLVANSNWYCIAIAALS